MKKEENLDVPKNKLIAGSIILIVGFLAPLLIPFVTASDLSTTWKTTLSGLLALGIPELFMLIAIGVMGKPGYEFIKGKIIRFFKTNGPPEHVSKKRYIFGLVLFSIPLLYGIILPYSLKFFPWLYEHLVTITIISDVLTFTSLWILGGDFWDKLRSLFIYNSKVNFENTKV